MKKNILVVQTLLLLPLLTPSLSINMEPQPSTIQKQQIKKQQQRGKFKKQNSLPQQNQQKKPSWRDIVTRSIKQANAQTNAIKTYPTIITESSSFTPQSEDEAQSEIIISEKTMQASEKMLEELKASFILKNQQHHLHTNSIDLTAISEMVNCQQDNNAHEIKVNYDEFPFLVHTLESTQKQTSDMQPTTSTSSIEAINIPNINIPNELLQSVMLPTEEKGLGFFGSLSYYTRDSIKTIISYLQNNTFETDNDSYFKWLNEAIQQAAARNDFDSLTTITALCQENEQYKDKIRISNESATTSFNFFTTKYTQEITQANSKLEDKHKNTVLQYNARTVAFAKFLNDAIDTYKKDIQNIANDYDAEVTKENARNALMKHQIATFSKLNGSIREHTKNLLEQHHINAPNNKCAKKIDNAQVSLNLLVSLSNKLPTIKEHTLTLTNNVQ